jgi:hypothetical protein
VLPAGVSEEFAAKLDSNVKANNELLERMADLEAEFRQVQSENQSIRLWYSQHLNTLWDAMLRSGEKSTNLRDAVKDAACVDPEKKKFVEELLSAGYYYLGIPRPPLRIPSPLVPPANGLAGPEVPAGLPPGFFDGMQVVGPSVVESTAAAASLSHGPPSPRPSTPLPHKALPAVRTPSASVSTLIPPPLFNADMSTTPAGPMYRPDELTPYRSSRRASVTQTPQAVWVAGTRKRAMSSLDEREEVDDEGPKKQKLL